MLMANWFPVCLYKLGDARLGHDIGDPPRRDHGAVSACVRSGMAAQKRSVGTVRTG